MGRDSTGSCMACGPVQIRTVVLKCCVSLPVLSYNTCDLMVSPLPSRWLACVPFADEETAISKVSQPGSRSQDLNSRFRAPFAT